MEEATPRSAATAGDEVIPAAGGVVWRRGDGDRHQFAIIHRPKYDDWTLPKGKLDSGESHEHAALREVEEETGWVAELAEELGVVEYPHGRRRKQVRYWAMPAVRGRFTPNDEVDDLRWLELAAARATLTYERDREVLDRFARGHGA